MNKYSKFSARVLALSSFALLSSLAHADPQWIGIGGNYKALRPSAIGLSETNSISVYGVGQTNGLYQQNSDNGAGQFSDPIDLGGALDFGPDCHKETDQFRNGVACYGVSAGSVWREFIYSGAALGWNQLGGSNLTSGVSVVYASVGAFPNNHMIAQAFAQASDTTLWSGSSVTPGHAIQNWYSMGGNFLGAPSCVEYIEPSSLPYSRANVWCFGIGTDGAVWASREQHLLNDGAGGPTNASVWSGFSSLGGATLGGVAALLSGDGIMLTVRGSDTRMYVLNYSGATHSWSDWKLMGDATLQSDPTCVNAGTFNACFAVMQDGQMGMLKF